MSSSAALAVTPVRAAEPASARYRLFEVTGFELEYPVVDGELTAVPKVEEALRRLADSRPWARTQASGTAFSNEMAAHVVEVKSQRPYASLVAAEAALYLATRELNGFLGAELGLRLLPTALHPWLGRREAKIWRGAAGGAYARHRRLLGVGGHGWLNVQSCQVNLPFADEVEAVHLHNTLSALLPYFPALTAASPVCEGTLAGYCDSRLFHYEQDRCRIGGSKIPLLPPVMASWREYRRDVLRPIQRLLAAVPGEARLDPEWVNPQAVTLRFRRRAVEVRLLDIQECVKMDVAIAAFLRAAARWVMRRRPEAAGVAYDSTRLRADYDAIVRQGGQACVAATHLRELARLRPGPGPAAHLLRDLMGLVESDAVSEERAYLRLVDQRLAAGSLAERIVARIGDRRREGNRLRQIYTELGDCLRRNEPWEG